MISRNHIEQSAAVPRDAVGFIRLRSGLVAVHAHERPREITECDPTISEGRAFLGIEQGESGERIVREHITFNRPTIAKPRVLSAVVTRLSAPGNELVIEHGIRYEEYCEGNERYFTENLSVVSEPVSRENLFGAIALMVVVVKDLSASRTRALK